MNKLRITVTGYLPAATRWDTDYLGFAGKASKRAVGDVLAVWPIQVRGEYSAVNDWRGGIGFDFVPGRGNLRRPSYIGMAGVARRRTIRNGSLLCSQVRSNAHFESYYSTDTPLGTDGIGYRRGTDEVLQMVVLSGIIGAETDWRVF